jgi:hypothetical protein
MGAELNGSNTASQMNAPSIVPQSIDGAEKNGFKRMLAGALLLN